jgi:hypothetical protein
MVSVIYIGTLNSNYTNLKLYITIVTNSNDFLPMSPAEIEAQTQKERTEHEEFERKFGRLNPKDFLQSASPEPTTGNIHHLEMAKKHGLQLFHMVDCILMPNDVIILYCIYGTHIYPVALSKNMTFVGMHHLDDYLEKGLRYQIDNLHHKPDERTTLSLLQIMLSYFTYHKGSSVTMTGLTKWFP